VVQAFDAKFSLHKLLFTEPEAVRADKLHASETDNH
jgi:hypothetical protein